MTTLGPARAIAVEIPQRVSARNCNEERGAVFSTRPNNTNKSMSDIHLDARREAERPPMTHSLKCWTEYYDRVENDSKPFEIRRNDRDYRAGDTLHLQDWDPERVPSYHEGATEPKGYTGRECRRLVTYVLPGGAFGLDEDFCVMGLRNPEKDKVIEGLRKYAQHRKDCASLKGWPRLHCDCGLTELLSSLAPQT